MSEVNELAAKVLSLISHKLRTPLSIINGYSEAIAAQSGKEKLSPFTEKAFEEINKQGNKMAALVDKLLRFAKIESMNREDVSRMVFNLRDVIEEASRTCLNRYEEDGKIEVAKDGTLAKGRSSVSITCQDDLTMYADKELMRDAFEELIDNALKFSNRLDKVVKVYCYRHSANISVSVKDTGVGIRPQDINTVFEKFYQVDDFFTGQVDGWGLGLPLVKRVMDLHTGSVSVVSDKGLGSILTVNIPD
ncbi:His Kinase A (phospho-acceptor) domain-containing protein [Parelusimicrobium proximum]|uniref:sensor histidine kinase n=1 Tax=Parelusimicrobium proximum TaxID=3228953 RepID=UPI003D171861